MSPEYLRQLERVDAQLAKVLDVLPDGSTVLVQADHGGHERNHGTEDPLDMTIPWLIAGPGVKQNHAIQTPVSLLDTAPTLARVMGVRPHEHWEGKVVEEVFGDQ